MDSLVEQIYQRNVRDVYDEERANLDKLAEELAATGLFHSSHHFNKALEVVLKTSEIRFRSVLTAHQEVFETTKKKPTDETVSDASDKIDEFLRDDIKRVHQKMQEVTLRLGQKDLSHGLRSKIDREINRLAQAVKADFKIWKSKEQSHANSPLGSTVFVIMRLGPEAPDVKTFYEDVICSAISEHNLIAKPVDETEGLENISTRILKMIDEAPFVIADLTDERPNCYFEAGYALGKGKHVLFTARVDHDPRKLPRNNGALKVHFDLDGHNITYWDPDNLDSARTQLAGRIRNLKSIQ